MTSDLSSFLDTINNNVTKRQENTEQRAMEIQWEDSWQLLTACKWNICDEELIWYVFALLLICHFFLDKLSAQDKRDSAQWVRTKACFCD